MEVILITDVEIGENFQGPSSLLAEIASAINLRVIRIRKPNKFNKLGFYKKKLCLSNERYDRLLCYPSHLFFALEKKDRDAAVVIGPDCATMLYKRFARLHRRSLSYVYYSSLSFYYFNFFEKEILRESFKYLLVGRSDVRYLKICVPSSRDNVCYLVHPCFGNYERKLNMNSVSRTDMKNIILSGDLSYKYVGNEGLDLIYRVYRQSRNIQRLIVVGQKNKWLYRKLLKRIPINKLTFEDWIDDYTDICKPGRDIHLFPLYAGAGTKNRVLTANMFQCKMIGTHIAFENTHVNRKNSLNISFSDAERENELSENISKMLSNGENLTEYNEYCRSRRIRFNERLNSILKIPAADDDYGV